MTKNLMKELEDTIKALEELNEREERKLNSHKLLVDNPVLGDIEILNYDKQKHLALILICNNTLEPYVIADGFDVSDGTWGAGTYFRTIESAERGYRKALNHRMDESMYYQETVKHLIKEDLSDMQLTEKEVDVAFDYLMNESNSPTIINENDVDEIRECVEKYRDEIERQQIIEQRKLKQEKLSNEKISDWCIRKDVEIDFPKDCGLMSSISTKEIARKIDQNITFSELFAPISLDNSPEGNDYVCQTQLLGIRDLKEFKAGYEFMYFEFIDLLREHYFQEIKDEPYYTCNREICNMTIEGYGGQRWNESDYTYRNHERYYIFKDREYDDYIITKEDFEPIGITLYPDIEEALDDFEIMEDEPELPF